MNNYSKTRVRVAGASGYAGRELVRLLRRHPGAALCESGAEVVLLATPPEASRQAVAALGAGGGPEPRVIDLSDAFRRDAAGGAVYGWPEKYRERIRGARLVANPGCYATAALTALWPLLAAALIEPAEIVCDAKSGASGAGKGLRADLHFCELESNCKAYHAYTHRHAPEIAVESGLELETFAFIPHLLPTSRGILATCYVRLRPAAAGAGAAAALGACYSAAYAGHPFVRLRGERLPELNEVTHTNYCDLGWAIRGDGRQAVIVSCLDNLMKGAAGQAVQNFNLMTGWPEETALQ
ncbi:MAG: N-acetyl-gamma-glutamyl-phosphate reductase [Terriglobales bacterium]